MKNFLILIVLVVAVAAGVYFYLGSQNGQNPMDGLMGSNSATQSTSTANTSTEAADEKQGIQGLYCHTDTADRTLVIHKKEGSPDLTFGVSYWFENGRNCGVAGGTAKLADDQKWTYTHEMLNETTCSLNISVNADDSIEISEGDIKCSELCGADVEFGTATFPAKSWFKSASMDDAMQANELALCP